MAVSTVACGSVGLVHQKELVLLAAPPGQTRIGRAVCFASAQRIMTSTLHHFVCYVQLEQRSKLEWAESSGEVSTAFSSEIRFSLPYFETANACIIPFLPDPAIRDV